MRLVVITLILLENVNSEDIAVNAELLSKKKD